MKNKLKLTAEYVNDLRKILDYLGEVNVDSARKTNAKISKTLSLLADCPQMGKLVAKEGQIERRIFIEGDYVILYNYNKENIELERIVNHYQDYAKYI